MENQDKYPDMETWLAHHGFKAHPFENILAEKDPYLDNYFEYFPFLREIEKPRSSFLFLERGKGKSANRIILTQQCDKSLKTSEKKLAVPYTDFSRLIKKDKVIPIRYQKMRFDFDIYRYKTRKKPTSESE